jgi:hypothetical protein
MYYIYVCLSWINITSVLILDQHYLFQGLKSTTPVLKMILLTNLLLLLLGSINISDQQNSPFQKA